MSKVSHLPKNIPSKELPFTLTITGSTTGHIYQGTFAIKVPEVREMTRVGVELARLGEGVPFELLDSNTRALNNAIAYLKTCLSDGPAWFINSPVDEREEGMFYGLNTHDINVPIEVFREADRLVKNWYDALKGQPEVK